MIVPLIWIFAIALFAIFALVALFVFDSLAFGFVGTIGFVVLAVLFLWKTRSQ